VSENADDKLTFADSQCYLAAMTGDTVAVIRWVRRGVRIDRLSKMGLLVQVADRGLLDVVRVLLDEGADPNFGMARGAATPLWACAKSGHADIFNCCKSAAQCYRTTRRYSAVSSFELLYQVMEPSFGSWSPPGSLWTSAERPDLLR
jgi:hypothetical protein